MKKNGFYGGYGGYDEQRQDGNPLESELFEAFAAAKAAGRADDRSLEEFYSKAGAYLTEEQRARLRALIDRLKEL